MFMSNKASPGRGAGGHYGRRAGHYGSKVRIFQSAKYGYLISYVCLLRAYNLYNLVQYT